MVKRPGRGDFPDLHVYPGGKVDSDDEGFDALCSGIDDAEASSRVRVDAGGLKYWVAVIRECYEEAGVLLAERDGAPFEYASDAERARFRLARQDLIDGTLKFSDFVTSEGLRLATHRVQYLSHWITPEGAPARFDTRFFVAGMPEGQTTDRHESEVVSGDWVTPKAALEHHEAGRWQMIYPTFTNLGSVAGYARVDEMIDAVVARRHVGEITTELHRQGMQYDSK